MLVNGNVVVIKNEVGIGNVVAIGNVVGIGNVVDHISNDWKCVFSPSAVT